MAIDLVKNDYNRKLQCFVLASGSCLSFRQGVFSLVYSSTVLEHIEEREACLDKTKRVLPNEGTVVTVVPTYFWKCLELLLAPVRWFIDATAALANRSNIKKLLGSSFLIHGIYPSNRTELLSYKTEKWVRLHEKSGFEIVRVRNLMAYLPLEFPVPLECMLNHMSACAVMIVGKARYELAGPLRSR